MKVSRHDLRESKDDLLGDSYSFMCHKGGAFGVEHIGAILNFDYCPYCGEKIDLDKPLSAEKAYEKDMQMLEELKNE